MHRRDFLAAARLGPAQGLHLCNGTAEMLDKPGEQRYDVVHRFGERQKVFLVHLRNIRGRRDDLEEVYPDEGAAFDYGYIKRVLQTLASG